MELEVWQGDWGLPSVDPDCLAVMVYCKFSSAPVSIKKVNSARNSPKGELPLLKDGDKKVVQVPAILDYLRTREWGIDFDLSSRQSADIIAFSALLEQKLLPAMLYVWWVDNKNYNEFTQAWYSRVLPFPSKFYAPSRRHHANRARLTQFKCVEGENNSELEARVYRDARECMNLLSCKLGAEEFFFGEQPSSLDALVFGYLAPLLQSPLPNATLQNHLKECRNLCTFCTRICSDYFPEEKADMERTQQTSDTKIKFDAKNTSSLDFPNKKRNMAVYGLISLMTMIGYAFLSGMITIEMTDSYDEGTISATPEAPNFQQFDDIFEEEEKKPEEHDTGEEEDL